MLLECAEKFHLKMWRHLAYLIKEYCSVLREFKDAHASLGCTRKRSGFVPEELTFEKLLWHCSAVYSHKRSITARPLLVNEPGHHLLTTTALPKQKNRTIYLRNFAPLINHFLKSWRAGYYTVLHAPPLRTISVDNPMVLDYLSHHAYNGVRIKRFGDEIRCPTLHSLNSYVY
jgi:hypothetical protein